MTIRYYYYYPGEYELPTPEAQPATSQLPTHQTQPHLPSHDHDEDALTKQLVEMGFTDIPLNTQFLQKHSHVLQDVVDELVDTYSAQEDINSAHETPPSSSYDPQETPTTLGQHPVTVHTNSPQTGDAPSCQVQATVGGHTEETPTLITHGQHPHVDSLQNGDAPGCQVQATVGGYPQKTTTTHLAGLGVMLTNSSGTGEALVGGYTQAAAQAAHAANMYPQGAQGVRDHGSQHLAMDSMNSQHKCKQSGKLSLVHKIGG